MQILHCKSVSLAATLCCFALICNDDSMVDIIPVLLCTGIVMLINVVIISHLHLHHYNKLSQCSALYSVSEYSEYSNMHIQKHSQWLCAIR